MNKDFFNFPEKVDITHYEKIREEVREIFSKDKTVLSIYEYGSVSSPGVSDIDLIFVLKDLEIENEDSLNLLHASEAAQRLVADGNVIKMPKETMEKLLFVDNLFPKKLLGSEINILEPSIQEKSLITLVALIDWLPERILKLIKILNSRSININNALCTLHSFCYSIKTLDKILDSSHQSSFVIKQTSELRNNWYSFKNPCEDLLELLERAIDLGHKQIFNYLSYLRNTDIYMNAEFSVGSEVDLELYADCFIRFKDTDTTIDYKQSLDISNDKRSYVIIPSYFLPHFYHQSVHDGLISKVIRSKFNKVLDIGILSVNKAYLSTIQKKLEIMERNAIFLKRHNIKSGLLRFGFHFDGSN